MPDAVATEASIPQETLPYSEIHQQAQLLIGQAIQGLKQFPEFQGSEGEKFWSDGGARKLKINGDQYRVGYHVPLDSRYVPIPGMPRPPETTSLSLDDLDETSGKQTRDIRLHIGQDNEIIERDLKEHRMSERSFVSYKGPEVHEMDVDGNSTDRTGDTRQAIELAANFIKGIKPS